LKRLYRKCERLCELSHPVRVRGLKLVFFYNSFPTKRVAPRAGAWVETSLMDIILQDPWSHPVRVRGLKQENEGKILDQESSSHPVRVRGLKPVAYFLRS